MKHNEFKAYFKKKLLAKVQNTYDLVSIDESSSNRTIYLVDKELLKTDYVVTCFFGTNNYHIKVFKLDEDHQKDKKKLHQFVDKSCIYDEDYSYLAFHNIQKVLKLF